MLSTPYLIPHNTSPTCSTSGSQSFPTSVTVYYQNVRELRTKTNNLLLSLLTCDFDIVVLTETWLHSETASSELTCNYVIYRCDRNSSTSNLRRGGGVLIAVKSELNCKAANLTSPVDLEQTIVQIVLPHLSVYICCVYIRPNSHPDIYTKHVESVDQVLKEVNAHDIILCLGDYNLPNLTWRFDEDLSGFLPTNVSTEQEIALVEPMLSTGLYQINDVLNVNDRLLDLVFVSDPCIIDLFESPSSLLKIDAHHKPIILSLDARSRHARLQSSPELSADYDFSRCDYHAINNLIASQDWNQLLDQDSVDNSVATFYHVFNRIISETVPVKAERST